ncbi:hypothetical protein DFH08DRAFT_818428 [Mycena albidolilacea]|uniref:Uncharacterized protein n=1 Tax=Mycena albidolilacea TaxID=1033008 RepID=A0AAD6ZG21_9AGAR|nr:hypothetical protein DFH08DRAFT_818428 [Mycena albidolilacea]
MNHLDLLATLASAAPSVPTRIPLGARDCNTDYYCLSTYQGDNIDTSSYDISSYVPIYSVNSGSDDHTSGPTAGVSGCKRPASPTSLLGNSLKRAHFDNSYVNWSSPPVPTLSTTTRPPGVSSAPAAPVKRGPSCPCKSSVATQIQIPAPVAPAFQPLPEAPGETKIKQDLVPTKGWWAVNELSAFYEFCLGQDADAVFKKITLSSNKCWEPVHFLGKVGITRDARQMKNHWETSLAMYNKLVPLLKITGGGADNDQHPDWEDKTSVAEFRQQRAGSGHDVDGLAAAKVKMWLTNRWYDLFHSRYNENPKANREVSRSSAEGLSDIEEDLHANNNNNTDVSDDDVIVVEKPKVSSTTVSSSIKITKKGATDPRDVKPSTWSRSKPAPHTHSAKVKKEERLSSLSSYREGRTQVDKKVMKIAREDANFMRLQSGTAQEIVVDDMGKYSEKARTKANLVLERLMDAALGL